MSDSNSKVTRRGFMHGAGALAAAALVGTSGKPATGKVRGANDRIGVGFIGCGGRSGAHFQAVHWLKTQGNEIVFAPAQESKKKPQRVAIEHGEDFVEYWRGLLACCRSRTTETASPMDLAYHVQTALQMAMLGWKQGKVARFDLAAERIIL